MKFLFSAFAFAVIFTSCSTGENTIEEGLSAQDMIEKRMADYLDKHENPTVEHATLDEINETMIANGLAPFSNEDVELARTRSILDCATWIFLGDYNDDGALTTYDLVLAGFYICQNAPTGCNGSAVTINAQLNPFLFGYLSAIEDGGITEPFLMNDLDSDLARGVILHIILCN